MPRGRLKDGSEQGAAPRGDFVMRKPVAESWSGCVRHPFLGSKRGEFEEGLLGDEREGWRILLAMRLRIIKNYTKT